MEDPLRSLALDFFAALQLRHSGRSQLSVKLDQNEECESDPSNSPDVLSSRRIVIRDCKIQCTNQL